MRLDGKLLLSSQAKLAHKFEEKLSQLGLCNLPNISCFSIFTTHCYRKRTCGCCGN